MMKKRLVQLTDELWQALDQAADGGPLNPWLESALWRLNAVRDAAAELGIKRRERPVRGWIKGRPRKTRGHKSNRGDKQRALSAG